MVVNSQESWPQSHESRRAIPASRQFSIPGHYSPAGPDVKGTGETGLGFENQRANPAPHQLQHLRE